MIAYLGANLPLLVDIASFSLMLVVEVPENSHFSLANAYASFSLRLDLRPDSLAVQRLRHSAYLFWYEETCRNPTATPAAVVAPRGALEHALCASMNSDWLP